MRQPTDTVCLVTGATSGIGKATATGLAALGATVIVHGRDADRCDNTAHLIRRVAGHDRAHCAIADFTSLDAVRDMADEVLEHHEALHVVVNNAGTYMQGRKETVDGFETTFQVNHLAPFLLTNLLLDRLAESAPARIVNVTSVAHTQVHEVDFEDLQAEKGYSAYGAYALSKLANVLFTYELARRLEGTGVTANCLHPGVIATKLLHEGFPGTAGESSEEGAATSIYVATSPELEGVTGRYFRDLEEVPSARISHDRELQRRMWDASAELTGSDRERLRRSSPGAGPAL
jgi:NAD(P)-dependent dehydrogenase (short-subunit alcohol dehydrogenase family)